MWSRSSVATRMSGARACRVCPVEHKRLHSPCSRRPQQSSVLTCSFRRPYAHGRRFPSGINRERGEASDRRSRGCPRNCKRRIFRHHATGLSGPGKATEGGDPRARRPAVSRGHTRACRSGCTDSSRASAYGRTAGETSFAVTCHNVAPEVSYHACHRHRGTSCRATPLVSARVHRPDINDAAGMLLAGGCPTKRIAGSELPEVVVSRPSARARPAAPRSEPHSTAARTLVAAPEADAAVVYSPTAIPTLARDIASPVTVITSADIAREQRRTVPDAL